MFVIWCFLELCVFIFIRFIYLVELYFWSLFVFDLKLSFFLIFFVFFICVRVGVVLIERENNRCDKLESKLRLK